MMKTKLVFALLSVCMILTSAAAFGQKLYPVQGPLASLTTPPVFSGQIRRPMFGGALPTLLKSWTLTNGEVLPGKCAEMKASSVNTKTPGTPESYPPQPNLHSPGMPSTGRDTLLPTFLAGKFGRESSREIREPFSRWRYWISNTARRLTISATFTRWSGRRVMAAAKC